jgi:ABC-type antimicrobial peptide transport system permease subunit
MNFTMWLILGIFTYLAIGYIFVCLADANEDGFWNQVKVILFWPILWIMLAVCYIVFIFIVIRNRIKRKNYD